MTHALLVPGLLSFLLLGGYATTTQEPARLRGGLERLPVAGQPAPAPAPAAPTSVAVAVSSNISFSVEGTRQGVLVGEGSSQRNRGKLVGVRYEYELESPRDAATGQASGKRMHKPVSITREVGAASPQLFQAACTNEVLKSVVIEFSSTNANGEELVGYSVKLTNATLARIHQFSENNKLMETCDFTFQKIEVGCPVAKTAAADDWNASR